MQQADPAFAPSLSIMSTPIFSLRVPEVFEALETSAEGLTQAEAETRLALYGQNILSQQKKEPVWEKLLHELIHPPALVLLVVGLVALLAARWDSGLDHLEHYRCQHRIFLLA